MKYFTEEISVSKDGIVATAITERASKEDALSGFHQIMASAYINNNLASMYAEAKNSLGGKYDSELYKANIEPDPEHPDVP